MLEKIVLKRILDVVQRLENDTKKRSIRIDTIIPYWPFGDIYKWDEQSHILIMGNIDQLKKTIPVAALVLLASSCLKASTLDIGLVANYKFNGDYSDSSQAGNNLLPSVGAILVTDRFGKNNSAMESSNQSYAQSTSNISVSGVSSRTVSIWAKSIDPNSGFFYAYWGGQNSQRADGVGGNLAISYLPWKITQPWRAFPEDKTGNIYVDGNYWVYLTTTDPIDISGSWHNLVYTYDNVGMASSVYLNGVIQANNASSTNMEIMNTVDSPIHIGAPDASFDIFVDDMRVYNRALSSAEVANLYANESVPEPSALSLCAVGLGGWAMMRRRRS
jgi:hypothetical protein